MPFTRQVNRFARGFPRLYADVKRHTGSTVGRIRKGGKKNRGETEKKTGKKQMLSFILVDYSFYLIPVPFKNLRSGFALNQYNMHMYRV